MTLNSDGTWSGTATATGTFNFTVTATDAGGVTGSRAYTLTINPVLNVASDVTVTEGNAGTTNATFTVTLTPASAQTVTVHYSTQDSTATVADSDYVAIPDTLLTFNPSETSKLITVLVNGDNNVEPNEQFFFNINTPTNANISFNQRSGFITNDDALLNVTTDPTVTEGNSGTTPATFTVTLTPAVPQTVTVHYSTQDNTATVADNDYIAIPDTLLTFNPFETTKSINVLVKGDTNFEPTEQFFFNINNPLGANISDNQGIGTITNDDVATETDVAVTGGNLVLTDGNGGTTDDTLTISLNGANVRINDPNHTLGAGAGATQVDANTVDVPLASITGNIQVNTLGGNDTLTLDLAGGNFIPAGGLTFNGGNPTVAPGDKLVITGGSQGTVTYNYTNAHDGSIVMSAFGTVTYTGLEPITNSGTATDIVFNLPAGPNAATLGDDGTGGNTMSRLSGATFEATDFANPTGSLTINRGNAADTLTVNALPDFNASLTIGSGANPFSTLTFTGAVTLAANKSLSGDASSTINLPAAGSDLATSGTGTISLTTARDITLVVAAQIRFRLAVVNGEIAAHGHGSVTGDISITGHGRTDLTSNRRSDLDRCSVVSTGAAKLTIDGTGGQGTSSNTGVRVIVLAKVTSAGGDISFHRAWRVGDNNRQSRCFDPAGALVSATGGTKITLDGTAGGGTNNSTGVIVATGRMGNNAPGQGDLGFRRHQHHRSWRHRHRCRRRRQHRRKY